MPNIVVQILFSGLIAYSPSGDGKSLVVMVPNEVNASRLQHQAFLSVQAGKVEKSDSDFVFEYDPIYHPAERTYVGGGYDLSILSLSNKNPLLYQHCRNLLPVKGSTSPEPICLLRATEIMDAGATASLDALAGIGFPVANKIALRVELKTGKFGPYDQSESDEDDFVNGRKVEWDALDGTMKSQFAPEILQWVAPDIPASEVVLVLKPLDGGPARRVTISPNSDNVIKIRIYNEPNAYEFCSKDFVSMRHMASHLRRLEGFSLSKSMVFRAPELAVKSDRDAVDAFCDELGKFGGREPVICYGAEMGR